MIFSKEKLKINLGLIMIIIAVLASSASCDFGAIIKKHVSGPATMNIETELCSYSFEYEGSYDLDGPSEGTIKQGYFYLGMVGPMSGTDPGDLKKGILFYRSGGIGFNVNDTRYKKDAGGDLKEWLDSRRQRTTILGQSKINIAGVNADEVIYEEISYPGPIERWNRDIYFDAYNLIWRITASAEKDKPVQTSISQDFDHMLKSLKLIRGPIVSK